MSPEVYRGGIQCDPKVGLQKAFIVLAFYTVCSWNRAISMNVYNKLLMIFVINELMLHAYIDMAALNQELGWQIIVLMSASAGAVS